MFLPIRAIHGYDFAVGSTKITCTLRVCPNVVVRSITILLPKCIGNVKHDMKKIFGDLLFEVSKYDLMMM